jgi:Fe-S-cluster-containing dehydrogenase component
MKLLIDLEALRKLPPEAVECSYRDHPGNRGVVALIELAAFSLICRRCEQAPCVLSCPQDALEKQQDDIVKRYVLRCSNCYSCSAACPFGIIIPEFIPLRTSVCDYCLSRLEEGEIPACARSVPGGEIRFGEFEADEKAGVFPLGEYLLVKAERWLEEKT